MIKAGELMPDNLIWYIDPANFKKRIVKIDAVKRSIASIQEKHDSNIELWLPLLNCEGIPLTSEWLEKFGFEKSEPQPGIIQWYGNGMTMEGGKNWAISPAYGYWVDIQYVHQLQNLFLNLTGEELTIKETAWS